MFAHGRGPDYEISAGMPLAWLLQTAPVDHNIG